MSVSLSVQGGPTHGPVQTYLFQEPQIPTYWHAEVGLGLEGPLVVYIRFYLLAENKS